MNKEFLLLLMQALPNGKSRYPIELVVDKLNHEVCLNIKIHLTDGLQNDIVSQNEVKA